MAFPVGWTRQAALVVQSSQCSGTQSNFPTLVTEATFSANCQEILTTGNANSAQADGGDLRFSSDPAGVSQLACEVVVWTQNATFSSAKAEVWVGGVAPSSGGNVTIYVWYKAGGGQTQPAANASFGSQAVWDTNYFIVQHLPNGSTLTLNDSTSNANNLTNNGGTAGAGKIDGCITLNGSSQFANKSSATGAPTGNAARTFSCWLNPSSISNANNHFAVCEGTVSNNAGLLIGISDNAIVANGTILITTAGGANDLYSATQAVIGSWSYVVGTYDGAGILEIYANGVSGGTKNITSTNTANSNFFVGKHVSGEFFAGAIDEVRGSKIVRSAGWILTEYNNQNSPGTFIIANAPTSILGGGLMMTGCGA